MDLAELEAEPRPEKKPEEPIEPIPADLIPEEDQILVDLNDAIILLTKSKHFIDYLSDPDLCRTVGKKEREGLFKLSGKLKVFLDEMEVSYGEGYGA